MMYELLNYRQIFLTVINGLNKNDIEIEELRAELELESTRILNCMQNNVCHMPPDNISNYISLHQQALNSFLSDLFSTTSGDENQNPENIEQKIIPESASIFATMSENLLSKIQKYFPVYFDYKISLPQPILETTKQELNENLAQLIKVLNAKGINDDANPITTMFQLVFKEQKEITYERKIFLESFLENLTYEVERSKATIETLDLILLITALNFNSSRFYDFCCEYFNRQIDSREDLSAQYRTLNIIKKNIKQIFPLTTKKYDLKMPSIQDSLLAYIDSELDYLQSMDRLATDLHSQGLLDAHYKVTFTVKQLAIWIHLQVKGEIIIAETPKSLHEYIGKHYSTNDTERISAKSFKNAYYSASTEDLEKVIDKIVTMLAIAQEKL